MNRHILVIGGGPAGLEAARTAALAGAKVTLVCDGPLGGRAGWHSLIPSKVWLSVADSLGEFMVTDQVGLNVGCRPEVDYALVLSRIREIAMTWNRTKEAELEHLGVTIVIGHATFTGPHTVLVQKKLVDKQVEIHADRFIVTSGSQPIFPPSMEPDGTHIIAPRFARHLEKFPESILVIGAGPTGAEFTYLFNRLGLAVTWIYDVPGILPGFARPAGEFLGQSLDTWGVNRIEGRPVVQLEKRDTGVTAHLADGSSCSAEMAFIAVGRSADLEGLNLPAAGLLGPEPLHLDAYGRSNQDHIYLAGDVAGGEPKVANRAQAQGWVAGCHAAGTVPPPFRPETIIAAVYTDPQVAQVGKISGPDVKHVRVPLESGLKTHLHPESEGFLELTFAPDSGRILGAVAVGPHAADMLTPIGIAIHTDQTMEALASFFPAHPTWSEIPFHALRKALRNR